MKKYLVFFGLLAVYLLPVNVSGNTIPKETWDRIEEKYDYPPPKNEHKKEPEKKEKKEKQKPEKDKWSLDLSPLQMLLYGALVVLFIFIIVYLVRQNAEGRRLKKVQLSTTFDEENPDELILSELQKELNNAALAENYNRCLRYQFLLMLESLQERGLIKWHKYSTNGEYLNQLLSYKLFKTISDLTLVYEYYWYGEHTLSLERYTKLVEHFDNLKERMNHE